MNIETINPLLVAAKLDAVKNFLLPEVREDIEKNPRFVHALWYLQWVSMPENYAGGLARFTHDLIERYSEKIGPKDFCPHSKMTLDEIEAVLKEFPDPKKFFPKAHSLWEGAFYSSLCGIQPEEETEYERVRLEEISALTASKVQAICIEAANEDLSVFLYDVCTNPEVRFLDDRLWFFSRLWECLFDFMDRKAEEVLNSFAETSITKEIFEKLLIAQEIHKGVMFLGNSRFGKSHAIRAYARMHPWSVRLLECPPSGSESDLLREICRTLGIRFARTTPPLHEQRAAIDKVIRSARFLIIADEFQFLFPMSGSRHASPKRLEYIRRQFMDIGIPTAFICTARNWQHVEKNYLKFSTYAQEQFDGRLAFAPIHLPSELSEDEMLDVARVHLPELDVDYLKFLVAPIRACKGDHLSYIENISLISRRYASQRGHSTPQLEDIKKALSDVLGCFLAPGKQAPAKSVPDTRTDLTKTRRPRSGDRQSKVETPALDEADFDEESTIFDNQKRTQAGSLLRLSPPFGGQKSRIEDPALALAD
jgi:DNA transposition AAA+ family ATPase